MLTEEQVQQYLTRLGLEEAPEPTRAGLNQLIYAHQTHIPFETIGVHRSEGQPDLSVDGLFQKVMVEEKGGYCFELNKLFEELLASLGFSVRPILSRAVRGRDRRMPINHRGILVSLDEGTAFADVGFGGPMPAGALMLDAGVEQDICGETYIAVPTEDGWWKVDRITRAEADFHDDGLPSRRQTELELCTAAVEDIDFGSLSAFWCQPGTLFRDHEVVNLRTDSGYKGYKDGVLTLREGTDKTVVELKSDADRARALAEHFGLVY